MNVFQTLRYSTYVAQKNKPPYLGRLVFFRNENQTCQTVGRPRGLRGF